MRAHRRIQAVLSILSIMSLSWCSQAAEPAPPPAHPAVTVAKRLLGSPYRYGGATPKGFDCSGLVHYAFTHSGYRMPRTTTAQFESTFAVDTKRLQAGDLLFFKIEGKVSHVGIYVGNNRFIHAPSSGKRVDYASLSNPYWATRLVKAGRYF